MDHLTVRSRKMSNVPSHSYNKTFLSFYKNVNHGIVCRIYRVLYYTEINHSARELNCLFNSEILMRKSDILACGNTMLLIKTNDLTPLQGRLRLP